MGVRYTGGVKFERSKATEDLKDLNVESYWLRFLQPHVHLHAYLCMYSPGLGNVLAQSLNETIRKVLYRQWRSMIISDGFTRLLYSFINQLQAEMARKQDTY